MDYRYIIAISAGAIFLVLIISYVCRYVHVYRKNRKEKVYLEKYYNDPNLAHMDYDVANFSMNLKETDQMSIFEIISSDSTESNPHSLFGRIEHEEVEEIVGTFDNTIDKQD